MLLPEFIDNGSLELLSAILRAMEKPGFPPGITLGMNAGGDRILASRGSVIIVLDWMEAGFRE